MKMRATGFAALLLGGACFADDADRVSLLGAWESTEGTDQGNKVTWQLEANGEALHIIYVQGNQKLAEFTCATDGRECATKESGHAAKMSLWYNGSKLVMLETKGSDVVKRRFGIADAGGQMDVEMIPIMPTSRAETVHFKRTKTDLPNK